ncbi:crosslink repair DNA glycosylase YcaQ family protein [Pontiellaceae bacterium B12227]|nr:crosslink repair DNA glycosylase YcaQ family protein [Pontiellaceae bacterium B12227]
MIESLTIEQARKLVLHSQRLPPTRQGGPAVDATLSAIEQLGYVQIDTISVVQRAHHHTLWARNPRYQPAHLDQLVEQRQVFEYWSHAAAYQPMRDFRYSLVRKQALKSGEQNHWFRRDAKLMNEVIERISAEGPLMAKDFESVVQKQQGWGVKPAKQALETLFMQGDLMVSKRVNFHKVYNLTERVLPAGIDTSVPTKEEYARHLIFQCLEAHGLAQPAQIAYLRKNVKYRIGAALLEMRAAGEVLQVCVEGVDYYALPASLNLLNKPLSRSKLKILSPFDNLLIQRKRMKDLFDFDYQLECYVPAAKRKYGYFVLPVLWNGRLAARMDCKADRKTSVLHVHHLVLEPVVKNTDAFFQALEKELAAFMQFNSCRYLQIHQTTPGCLKPELQKRARSIERAP